MTDLLEQVGMTLCQSALAGKQCPCLEIGVFKCGHAYPGQQADAALAVIQPAYAETARKAAIVIRSLMREIRVSNHLVCDSVVIDGERQWVSSGDVLAALDDLAKAIGPNHDQG